MLEEQGLLSTHHRFDAEYSNVQLWFVKPEPESLDIRQTRIQVDDSEDGVDDGDDGVDDGDDGVENCF